MKMQWNKINFVLGDDEMARCLNRQIKTLEEFRKEVEAGTAKGRFFTGAEAENEALRREYRLQQHILRYLQQRSIPQPWRSRWGESPAMKDGARKVAVEQAKVEPSAEVAAQLAIVRSLDELLHQRSAHKG